MTTLLLYPEIKYERVRASEYLGPVKSDYFGYGLSAGVKLPGFTMGSDPGFDYYPEIYLNKYHILTFCRFYFNRRHQSNYHFDMKLPQLFFVEPTLAFVGFEGYDYERNANKDDTAICVGLGIGLKLITITNYTIEFHFGGGSNLQRHNADFYYRFGINIGRRSNMVTR